MDGELGGRVSGVVKEGGEAHTVQRNVGARRAGAPSPSGKRRRLRDAETTQIRVKVRRTNRRKVDTPREALRIAIGVLAVECIAALLFSPRLWVKRVVVEGNRTVPAASLVARLRLGEHDNLVRLPVGKLRAAILAEPVVETAEIHRRPPGTVRVVVKERTPWACVQLADGSCYVIDAHLVPFRTADVPPVGLPLLKLAAGREQVALGKPMSAPGLEEVSQCLAWAKARPDFPLDAVSIDSEGKLCLNKAGGAKILLGSGQDLDKKFRSLETLLTQRHDLQGTTSTVAYVNLYAYDAPAVLMRSASVTAAAHAVNASTRHGDGDSSEEGTAPDSLSAPPSSPSPDPDAAAPLDGRSKQQARFRSRGI